MTQWSYPWFCSPTLAVTELKIALREADKYGGDNGPARNALSHTHDEFTLDSQTSFNLDIHLGLLFQNSPSILHDSLQFVFVEDLIKQSCNLITS